MPAWYEFMEALLGLGGGSPSLSGLERAKTREGQGLCPRGAAGLVSLELEPLPTDWLGLGSGCSLRLPPSMTCGLVAPDYSVACTTSPHAFPLCLSLESKSSLSPPSCSGRCSHMSGSGAL